jgi:lipopolysaccharide/colanic/teichoic acid biosynthesis glycosyltransferase
MEAGSIQSHAIPVAEGAEDRFTAAACRALDIVGATLLLLLLAPLIVIVAAAVRLDSPGGAMFRQRRVGRHLVPFTVHKFRSMYASAGHDLHRAYVTGLITAQAEHAHDGLYKLKRDDRVTRIGRLLRKTSVDELPQLWNVVRGEMSLVGPRPSIPYEVEKYPEPWMLRFTVRPGITGLWQVSGRSELTWEQMIELDLEYVRKRSFWFNVRILLKTVPVVLLGKGAA